MIIILGEMAISWHKHDFIPKDDLFNTNLTMPSINVTYTVCKYGFTEKELWRYKSNATFLIRKYIMAHLILKWHV